MNDKITPFGDHETTTTEVFNQRIAQMNTALQEIGDPETGAIPQIQQNIIQVKTNLSMAEQKITEQGAQIAAIDAAKADKAEYTAALTAAGWTGTAPYTQTISVEGILATDKPHITKVLSGTDEEKRAQQEAWNMISDAEAAVGGILFTCLDDKPETDINIQIEVIR